MTYEKEALAAALTQVMLERVPQTEDEPEHVFSEKFERDMEKLLAQEAAHPILIRRSARRTLLVAAIAALLLLGLTTLTLAVTNKYGSIKRSVKSNPAYDSIEVSLVTSKERIEEEYVLGVLPEGYSLIEKGGNENHIYYSYENSDHDYITFSQSTSGYNGTRDNERTRYSIIEVEGTSVYCSITAPSIASADNLTSEIGFEWEQNGYLFRLYYVILSDPAKMHLTIEDVLPIYRGVRISSAKEESARANGS